MYNVEYHRKILKFFVIYCSDTEINGRDKFQIANKTLKMATNYSFLYLFTFNSL